ncbi:DUF421 domain-containing protein [Orenia marismortui]|uniref:Uncharacterized membrane protein YcaP (DUF421 family) n=1 Tax=Orenia marismortui TaxID=46469 RepID=A0A4R8GST9_9FIRM|nr:DUF421 domain-containing protein [Orenia marismortui]TDX49055.1 uncharacterized membrane protein YcaP (DUF421 family) [Orenia marismortui]
MILNLIIKTIIAYFLLLFLSRVIGRKIIAQMTFFDFAVGITVGTITGSIAMGSKPTSLSASIVLIILALLVLLTDYLHLKSYLIRKYFNSEPVVLVKNGKIVEENMKKTRYTINDLMMQLRKKNIFDIGDVEFAIVEIDGKVSVQEKSQKQPVTPQDLNLSTLYKGLTKDLIIDGEIMNENLDDARLDRKWLIRELSNKDIDDIQRIFYAGLDTSGNLYVSLKQHKEEKEGEYGLE